MNIARFNRRLGLAFLGFVILDVARGRLAMAAIDGAVVAFEILVALVCRALRCECKKTHGAPTLVIVENYYTGVVKCRCTVCGEVKLIRADETRGIQSEN